MIVFLRGFTHGLAHEIKQFVRNERGVVALIFAVLFPIIVGLLFTAFQFDMYNRNITRVEMAQSSALHAGRNQASDAEKIKYTKIWVKLNTDFVSGLNALRETDILARIDEGKKYLYVRTTMDDLSPVVSWAVKSHFQSIMRIPLENDSTPSGTCGKTYWEALRTCGKMSINQLRAIPNSERIKADQMALINIGKNFFNSDKTGKTKSEIKAAFGGYDFKGENILVNYVDNNNVGNDKGGDAIQTYLKDDNNNDFSRRTLDFMISDGQGAEDFDANSPDYNWQKLDETDTKNQPNHYAIINNTDDPSTNTQSAIEHTRYFYSDWMLEDMYGWNNVYQSGGIWYRDNCRTVRVQVTYDGDGNDAKVTSVRVRVNRGNSKTDTGTHMYELDVIVNATNYDSKTLSNFMRTEQIPAKDGRASTDRPDVEGNDITDLPLFGVQRWRSDNTYQNWFKNEHPGKTDPNKYYFHDQDDYYRWYKGYLMSTRVDGTGGLGAGLSKAEARAAANRIVYHKYKEEDWVPEED